MRKVEKIDFKSMKRMDEDRSRNKLYCKHCGHSRILPTTAKTDKIICNYCGHYIFKNDLIEFKYRLKEKSSK